MMIEKFNICIDQEQIDQLHTKLNLTRWPDEINDEFWSHGTGMHFLKDLSAEWLNTFNWRDHEEKLNNIGSYKYKTKSGLKIHFLHSKSNKDGAIPLVTVSYTHLTLPTILLV